MKQSTYEKKMAELFGIGTEVIEKVEEQRTLQEARRTGKMQGISEDEIEKFREMQAVTYFLQAPALFQKKICPRCKVPFLVSRLFVAYCSYDCIREQIREDLGGHNWEKGNDLEATAVDPQVWNGNEPLWIRNLERLRDVLTSLLEVDFEALALVPKPEPFYPQIEKKPEIDVMAQLAEQAGAKPKKAAKPKRKLIIS